MTTPNVSAIGSNSGSYPVRSGSVQSDSQPEIGELLRNSSPADSKTSQPATISQLNQNSNQPQQPVSRLTPDQITTSAQLIINASVGLGTQENKFIEMITYGEETFFNNTQPKKDVLTRLPLNQAEVKALDAELRRLSGDGLLYYMDEEFSIGSNFFDENKKVSELYTLYSEYGLKK